jgi:hypothetical protein
LLRCNPNTASAAVQATLAEPCRRI